MGARSTFTCEACGEKFEAYLDHGRAPRFCSRACWASERQATEQRECPTCGSVFKSRAKGERGHQVYCSAVCRNEGYRTGQIRSCASCNQDFYTIKSRDSACCSPECQRAFYRHTQSKVWRGGEYIMKPNGDAMTYMPRKGFAGKYTAKHRVVAAKAIGRVLFGHEIVIRVSGERDDIRPENLFICASMSEYAKRRSGSLPWPTHSNLDTYSDRPLTSSET